MKDHLIRATAFEGQVRAYAIQSTDMVEEARRRHDAWATTSAALGRTLTIGSMMGAMMKGDDKMTIKVEGNGPAGAIIVDAASTGNVRGYIQNPHVDFDSNEHGKLDVARAVGDSGSISVVKDLGLKDYFTGQVPIISGEIAEDFTYYFTNSEQVPSAVGAGVLVDTDYTISASGGFIIQMMPGASEETISEIERRLTEMKSVSTLVNEGKTPEEVLNTILGTENVKVLDSLPVAFECHCSRERIETAIASLGDEEIDRMIEEDGGAEATCHFCNEVYQLDEQDLKSLQSTS
ncbi:MULTISPECIES: Hsp33 family molecular chaperone HslO [Salimicrobium]|uniref:33 kDa chaperonin n=3 Tax=Salimicrobium TaxID=351195 RepID=K2FIR7_9BACI|nr:MULTISPECIES: Hsp33 family molecular chaperone HslO [Salimicrobium]AKG05633.1 Hsp33 family molecular chaperone [Salimicrobium jeotgali]EKE31001.1 HSP33-like chaperonin [Salimicrobium jeotgali]MBM7697488.1 molecular chaperone Hsp33 [Salimicrobium jeotgali]SDY36424.1 molecular chaperone Hsp33 [Salimicrobium album]SIS96750.1 molecular chaperone Hsp33 [Salimicrobium salexigens]